MKRTSQKRRLTGVIAKGRKLDPRESARRALSQKAVGDTPMRVVKIRFSNERSKKTTDQINGMLTSLGFETANEIEVQKQRLMEALAPNDLSFFVLRVNLKNKSFSLHRWRDGRERHIDSANIVMIDKSSDLTCISVSGAIAAGWDIFCIPITEADVARLIAESNSHGAACIDPEIHNGDELGSHEAA